MEIEFGKRQVQGTMHPDGGFLVETTDAGTRLWAPVTMLITYLGFSLVAKLQENGFSWVPAQGVTEEEFAVMSANLSPDHMTKLHAFMKQECGLGSATASVQE